MLSQQMVLYIGWDMVSTTFFDFFHIFYSFYQKYSYVKKIALPVYLPEHRLPHRPIPIEPFHWCAQ